MKTKIVPKSEIERDIEQNWKVTYWWDEMWCDAGCDAMYTYTYTYIHKTETHDYVPNSVHSLSILYTIKEHETINESSIYSLIRIVSHWLVSYF